MSELTLREQQQDNLSPRLAVQGSEHGAVFSSHFGAEKPTEPTEAFTLDVALSLQHV